MRVTGWRGVRERWRSVFAQLDSTFEASPELAALIAPPTAPPTALLEITRGIVGWDLRARERRPEHLVHKTDCEGIATRALRPTTEIMFTRQLRYN